VEEVVIALIEQQIQPEYDESRDVFLLLAKAAEEHDLRSDRSDISSHFDEFVEQSITEDFIKRKVEDNAQE
jgi:hypothetical protein